MKGALKEKMKKVVLAEEDQADSRAMVAVAPVNKKRQRPEADGAAGKKGLLKRVDAQSDSEGEAAVRKPAGKGAAGAAAGGKASKQGKEKAASKAATASASAAPSAHAAPSMTALLHTDDLSSDDEAPKNTIGNVPLEWYADYDHIGYDVTGEKLMKQKGKDGIDRFLASQDDPLYKWTIYDAYNDEEITLSRRDVEIIKNLHSGTYAHPEFAEDSPAYNLEGIYSEEKEIHALNSGDEPKRRFLPSKWEMRKIMKIVRAMRNGAFQQQKVVPDKPLVFLIWGDDDNVIDAQHRARGPAHIAAPKLAPPGHAASYNPPSEYLLTEAEKAAWEAMDPAKRPLDFLPCKFNSLRQVPLYAAGIRERFERCLDLYLCPRATKRKMNVDPESLLPKLPDPAELRPFPNNLCLEYSGHSGRVRSISLDPTGQWLCSGGDDGLLRMWEVTTGRLMNSWDLKQPIQAVQWNPNPAIQVIAAAADSKLYFLYPGTCTAANAESTFDALRGFKSAAARAGGKLSEEEKKDVFGAAAGVVEDDVEEEEEEDEKKGEEDSDDSDEESGKKKAAAEQAEGAEEEEEEEEAGGYKKPGELESAAGGLKVPVPANLHSCSWVSATEAQGFPSSAADLLPPSRARRAGAGAAAPASRFLPGVKVAVNHSNTVKKLSWHRRGDYCVTVCPSARASSVMIHQLSKHASQSPFKKQSGQMQAAAFHPSKPLLYIASQRAVRVWDLSKAEQVQKLESSAKWISSLELHPSGEHCLIGSYDCKTVWFDCEMSNSPFKTLRYHKEAVRRVAFHSQCPLMASASDDGSLHIFHARVFADTFENPVIVPVKILRGHTVGEDGLGVLDACFHPTQPWIFSAGADGSIKMWQNLP